MLDVYNTGGVSPSDVVLSFLLYATFVASYSIRYFTFVLRAHRACCGLCPLSYIYAYA